MKKLCKPILALLLLVCIVFQASAHPGRTDSSGGHYNRSTGEYHYHHGYPPHQHTNGICPYNYDDRANPNSGTNSYASSQQNNAASADVVEVNQEIPSAISSQELQIYDYVEWSFAASMVLPFIMAFFLGSGYKTGVYSQKIKNRNKIFLSVSVLLSVAILFVLCLIKSDFTGKIGFVHIANTKTGKPLSALGAIVIYGFIYWVFSTVIASAYALYSLALYGVLHRKDGGISTRCSSLPHENELDYMFSLSMGSVYVVSAIVLLLHVFGIIIFKI